MTSGKYQISQPGHPASTSQAVNHQFITPQQQPSVHSQYTPQNNSHDVGSVPVQAQGTKTTVPRTSLKRKRELQSFSETPVPIRQKATMAPSQDYSNEDLEYDDIQELEDELYEQEFGNTHELQEETPSRLRQPPPWLSHRSGTSPNDNVRPSSVITTIPDF